MSVTRGIRSGVALVLSLCASAAGAQQSSSTMQGAFRVGTARGFIIGPPQVDLNGGLLDTRSKDGLPNVLEAFASVRAQAGTFIKHIQIEGNVLFARRGNGPEFTTVVQSTQLSNQGHFFLGIGIGGVSRGDGTGMHGWAQGVFAARTSLFDLAPFVQVGTSFVAGGRAEWLFGLAHILAPYR